MQYAVWKDYKMKKQSPQLHILMINDNFTIKPLPCIKLKEVNTVALLISHKKKRC